LFLDNEKGSFLTTKKVLFGQRPKQITFFSLVPAPPLNTEWVQVVFGSLRRRPPSFGG
jgi:hypothetical protein